MNYILIFLSISFALGIITNYYLSTPFIWPLLLLLLLIPSLFLYRNEKRFIIAICGIFFFLGIAYEGVYSYIPQDHIVNYVGAKGCSPLTIRTAIIGVVDSPVETRRYSEKKTMTTFVVEAKKVRSVGAREKSKWEKVQGKVKVNAYNIVGANGRSPVQNIVGVIDESPVQNIVGVIDESPVQNQNQCNIQYGDEIRLWGELKLPPAATNLGQFDYRDYLSKYGIHVLMNVYGEKSVRNYSVRANGRSPLRWHDAPLRKRLLRAIFSLRNSIKHKIDTHIKYPYNTILAALLIGYRSEIPGNIRDSFVKTGTVHLFSISGLHVSIVAGALYGLLSLLCLPKPIKVFCGIFFMGFYAVLAGLRFPVLRSGIMGSVFFIGFMFERKKNIFHSLSLAFFLIVMFCPESLFLTGFQLSFITVVSIVVLFPICYDFFNFKQFNCSRNKYWFKIYQYLMNGVSLSIAVLIGAAVLIVYYFNVLSVTGLYSNILVVPYTAFIIISGMIFVLGSFFVPEVVSNLIAFVITQALDFLIQLIEIFGKVPHSFYYLKSFHPGWMVVYYCFLFLGLFLKKRYLRKFILLWCCVVFCVFIIMNILELGSSDLSVFFLEAGSSDIVFMKTSTSNCLINAGSKSKTNWVVKPFLMSQGINALDKLIVTSKSKKNYGGFFVLNNNFKINEIFVPNIIFSELADFCLHDVKSLESYDSSFKVLEHKESSQTDCINFIYSFDGFKLLYLSDALVLPDNLVFGDFDVIFVGRKACEVELSFLDDLSGDAVVVFSKEIEGFNALNKSVVIAEKGGVTIKYFAKNNQVSVDTFLE